MNVEKSLCHLIFNLKETHSIYKYYLQKISFYYDKELSSDDLLFLDNDYCLHYSKNLLSSDKRDYLILNEILKNILNVHKYFMDDFFEDKELLKVSIDNVIYRIISYTSSVRLSEDYIDYVDYDSCNVVDTYSYLLQVSSVVDSFEDKLFDTDVVDVDSVNDGKDFVSDSQKVIGWDFILKTIHKGYLKGNAMSIYDWVDTPLVTSYLKPDIVIPSSRFDESVYGYSGDNKPLIFLCLDFSESVPSELLDDLINLTNNTPDDFAKVVPLTWSDNVMLYDDSKNIIPAGNTNINNLYEFITAYKLRNRAKNVYAVIITDGVCRFTKVYNNKYERERMRDVMEHWFWIGLDDIACDKVRDNFKRYVQTDNVFNLQGILV